MLQIGYYIRCLILISMWFSKKQRSSWTRARSPRRGVFGGKIKSKEEISKLVDHIESHEEEEKKRADAELEKELGDIE